MIFQTEPFEPKVYESQGSVKIGGKTIPYKTVCQDNPIYNQEGKIIASLFSYSYFRTDTEDANRPVLFIFNGGPGSGSLWLHAGLFGPLRVKYTDDNAVNVPSVPPYNVIENDLCMLDICDLVMIDPVDTGFGRLLDKEAGENFFTMEEDADSFSAFVHSWLGRHDRWQSPKYLLGESYGTIRAALLAESLSGSAQNDFSAIGLNGIVLLGNAMGEGQNILEFNCEPAVLALPSMAAANWYHNKLDGTLEKFVKECYEFCESDYIQALFAGANLPEKKKNKIADKLVYFTGLKKEYILEKNIRPDMDDFLTLLLKDKGLEIGIYDGRFTLPANPNFTREMRVQDDPAISQYTPSFMAAMCGPIKKSLNITFDRKYYGISRTVGKSWKREAKRVPATSLATSMRRNPDLKVLFATGCYDMICQMGQARYLANHINLPMDRVAITEYASGHMAYLGEPSAKAFADDVRKLITGKQ